MTDLLYNNSTARNVQLYPDIVKTTSGLWVLMRHSVV